MKLVRWKRFTWDLTQLAPDHEPHLPSYYTVRAAARDEEKTVRNVIFTAFGLDSAWGDSFKQVRGFIESQLTSSFLHRAVPCLVITHGVRIIAASALTHADPDKEVTCSIVIQSSPGQPVIASTANWGRTGRAGDIRCRAARSAGR